MGRGVVGGTLAAAVALAGAPAASAAPVTGAEPVGGRRHDRGAGRVPLDGPAVDGLRRRGDRGQGGVDGGALRDAAPA